MLPRRLQLPLSRSVAPVWPRPSSSSSFPAVARRLLLLRRYGSDGSSRLPEQDGDPSSSSSPGRGTSGPDTDTDADADADAKDVVAVRLQQDDQQPQPSPQPGNKDKVSLYEELFPGEEKHARPFLDDTRHSRWTSRLLDELPRVPGMAAADDDQPGPANTRNPAVPGGMLVMSASSKNLVESDFLRLGVKGQHVEGWVSGILKGIYFSLPPPAPFLLLFPSPSPSSADTPAPVSSHIDSRRILAYVSSLVRPARLQ